MVVCALKGGRRAAMAQLQRRGHTTQPSSIEEEGCRSQIVPIAVHIAMARPKARVSPWVVPAILFMA